MSRFEELMQKLLNGETITEADFPVMSRLEKALIACINKTGTDGLGIPQSRAEELLHLLSVQMTQLTGGGIIDVEVLPNGWKGTPVPNEGYIEKIYFNTNLSVEEINNLLNVTYSDRVAIFDNESKNVYYEPHRVGYDIYLNESTIFSSYSNGWSDEFIKGENPDLANPYSFNCKNLLSSVDWAIPIGNKNSLISSLVSITPFKREEIDTNAVYRLPDGTLWMYKDGSWVELTVGEPETEELTVTPSGTVQEFIPTDGTYFSKVTVAAVSNTGDMLQLLIDNTNSCDNLFKNTSFTTLDTFSALDTSKVTDMTGMFYNCSSLTTAPQLDTSNVTGMNSMFSGCSSLTTIPRLNTSKVAYMNNMFYGCSSLTTIPQLDIIHCTLMNNMFYGCSSLTTIPQIDISIVTGMTNMFKGCSNLKSILMTGMKASFDISASTQFEQSDLVTILNNLATVTSTKTLTMGSTNLAKLTEEDKVIATAKGWTLK